MRKRPTNGLRRPEMGSGVRLREELRAVRRAWDWTHAGVVRLVCRTLVNFMSALTTM
jgi:hypothetical protein